MIKKIVSGVYAQASEDEAPELYAAARSLGSEYAELSTQS